MLKTIEHFSGGPSALEGIVGSGGEDAMTPHELPEGFPSEEAIEAAEIALAKARNGGDTIADQQRAEYRAAVAADWPLLREAAIKEAVAALPLITLKQDREDEEIVDLRGEWVELDGELISRVALERALLDAGKTP